MPRNCPSCGTVNYDDMATSCINCSASLPPAEEEVDDFSLDDIEKELEELTDLPVEESDADEEDGDDDALFFSENEEPAEDTPVNEETPVEEMEEFSLDDLDSLTEEDITAAVEESSSVKEGSEEELDDDDSLFFSGDEEEEEEDTTEKEPLLEETEQEEIAFGDLDSPYEETVVPEELPVTETIVPEEVGKEYAAPLGAGEEYSSPPDAEEEYSASSEETVAEEEYEQHEDEYTPHEKEYTPYQEDTYEAVEGKDIEEETTEPALTDEPAEKKISRSAKKALKKKDKRAARIVAMERELQNIEGLDEGEATPASFWLMNMVSLFFFVFLAIFVVTEFLLLMFNISASVPSTVFALSPIVGDTLGTPVLFLSVVLAGLDAVLHLWDKKFNLMLSFAPTGMMALGLAIGMYEGYVGDVDFLPGILLLFGILAFLAIDVIAWLEYPDFLQDVGRESLDTYVDANQKMTEIKSDLEQEYQDILAEEEEKLRIKEEEIQEIKSEIEVLGNQLSEEEEKIRLKDEEIASIQSELEVKKDDLMEEEEKLRLKEESLDSVVRAEVERYSQDYLAEEEEKIRIKEEELAITRSDLDIQKSMAEDMRERLRMKEYELNNVRSELESQLRTRLEEEEMLRIKETAARMGEKEKKQRTLFPFTAMVGQFKMKSALTLNAIYPGVGGVLIRGQKGTGKSVTVRGLAEVLPMIKVTGCKFNCDPEDETTLCYECRRHLEMGKLETYDRPVQVVDLPLNVTEDRLVGSIDIEKILSEGTKSFEPGILAEAHRGILYVDEINLLDDYIVDILLDAASSGQVVIEREGVSVRHPSHFIIVGSMNPEEGELRPQILDRIALQTDVVGIHDIESRMDIVKRRDEFTKDANTFRAKFEPEQENLRKRIEDARKIITSVTTPDRMLTLIARLCVDFDVDGHRADIIIERAARANAAFETRLEVTSEDVVAAAEMALPHRMRKRPYAEERFDSEVLQKWVKKIESEV